MAIDRVTPNLMGWSNGHQVMTLHSNFGNEWIERGEFHSNESRSYADKSAKTWEKHGHKVRIYELTRNSGKLVYETAHT